MTPTFLPSGSIVEVLVSEPFELAGRSVEAAVISSGVAADAPGVLSVLLRVREPIQIGGTAWEYFVARPAQSRNLAEVATRETVEAALTAVPKERATSSSPLDLSWWRGGLAILGSVSRR
jgi:hypothetical protein